MTQPAPSDGSPQRHLRWRLAALVIGALSLGTSFAHVLEAWPRVYVWSPELWREATVFNKQFLVYGYIGAPLDFGVICVAAALAYVLRADRRRFGLAVTGAVLFALALIVWASWIAPVNGVLAGWAQGPMAADFDEIRDRWESGHIVVWVVKLLGFMALSLAAMLGGRSRSVPID